jgi:hypothetical protein
MIHFPTRRALALAAGCLACASLLPALAAPPTATDLEKIGLAALRAELGNGAPTGAGITATQVEAPLGLPTQYMPNTSLADFAGKSITDKTGGGTVSSHATNIGQNFYGKGGIAPGIATVDVYNANDWLDAGFLRTLSRYEPRVETRKIQNHSWIADFSDGSDLTTAIDVLMRLDYVVNRDGVLAVAGVNNGTGSILPQVLANAYNVIAVGRSDGGSSSGGSTVDGLGRSKPDLVAPAPNTSVATSWVSGAAALLLQAGSGNPNSQRPETIKALLMAGASKSVFDLDGLTSSTLDDWSHSSTQPLDSRYGAGQLNIDASYHMLVAGQQSPGSLSDVLVSGWDYGSIAPLVQQTYFFTIPDDYVAASFSAVAAWNRQIAFTPGTGLNPAKLTPSLANLDLKLYAADGYSLGSLLEESVSTIDNIEHVFRRGLTSGHYALTISSDLPADFALAWNTDLMLLGDANRDGKVTGGDYTIWADHFGSKVARFTQGDFNGDGLVTGADYTIWADHFVADAGAWLPAVRMIPEPSSWVLAATAAAAILIALLRRGRKA